MVLRKEEDLPKNSGRTVWGTPQDPTTFLPSSRKAVAIPQVAKCCRNARGHPAPSAGDAERLI